MPLSYPSYKLIIELPELIVAGDQSFKAVASQCVHLFRVPASRFEREG